MLIKLDNIIKDVIKNKKIKRKIKENAIIDIWKELVGENVANISKPIKIEGNILFVDIISSTWAQELKFFENKILNDIKNKMNLNIKKIFFNIKDIKGNKKEENIREKYKKISLSEIDILKINNNLINIEDENIKQKIKEVMIKDEIFKRRKNR
ncbi:MAG: DUF721 domain-containing protein [Actinobacteria bacterium]|nr:DUF721 domain-containing protein [Actinomycetota bacterium]